MDHFLLYSFLLLTLTIISVVMLLVLVCSQCSTTRHSACLWRCISHLVFGILPVGSLMFSWQTVCHQVLAAGHLKPHSLGLFWEREWNTMYVDLRMCVWMLGRARNCEVICMHMCRGRDFSFFLIYTQGQSLALNVLWATVSERGLF